MDNSTEANLYEEAQYVLNLYTFSMKGSLKAGRVSEVLKDAITAISELRTSALGIQNYYKLYAKTCSELVYLYNFILNSPKFRNKLPQLYISAQHIGNVVPRCYLNIVMGMACIESGEKPEPILSELLDSCLAVQHPLRGLLLRRFLLHMAQNFLPDESTSFNQSSENFNFSFNFLMSNCVESTKLWIRLQYSLHHSVTDRSILRTFITANIQRIATLKSLNNFLFKEKVFPRIAEHFKCTHDSLGQYYILLSIIEFNVRSIWNTLVYKLKNCLLNINEPLQLLKIPFELEFTISDVAFDQFGETQPEFSQTSRNEFHVEFSPKLNGEKASSPDINENSEDEKNEYQFPIDAVEKAETESQVEQIEVREQESQEFAECDETLREENGDVETEKESGKNDQPCANTCSQSSKKSDSSDSVYSEASVNTVLMELRVFLSDIAKKAVEEEFGKNVKRDSPKKLDDSPSQLTSSNILKMFEDYLDLVTAVNVSNKLQYFVTFYENLSSVLVNIDLDLHFVALNNLFSLPFSSAESIELIKTPVYTELLSSFSHSNLKDFIFISMLRKIVTRRKYINDIQCIKSLFDCYKSFKSDEMLSGQNSEENFEIIGLIYSYLKDVQFEPISLTALANHALNMFFECCSEKLTVSLEDNQAAEMHSLDKEETGFDEKIKSLESIENLNEPDEIDNNIKHVNSVQSINTVQSMRGSEAVFSVRSSDTVNGELKDSLPCSQAEEEKIECKEKLSEEVIQEFRKVLQILNTISMNLYDLYPKQAFFVFLSAASKLGQLDALYPGSFAVFASQFFRTALLCYEDSLADEKVRRSALISLVHNIAKHQNVFDESTREALIERLERNAYKLLKSSDKCLAILECSYLFWNDISEETSDAEKVQQCIQDALEVAVDSISCDIQNIFLLPIIIDKYTYFLKKSPEVFPHETLESIMKLCFEKIHGSLCSNVLQDDVFQETVVYFLNLCSYTKDFFNINLNCNLSALISKCSL